MCGWWLAVALAVGWGVGPAGGQEPGGPWDVNQVFDQPYIFHQLNEVMGQALQLGRLGRVEQMEQILEGVVERVPAHPVPLYNLACAKARLGKTDEALDALERAVAAGLAARDEIARDADFIALRNHPRFDQVLRRAAEVTPFALTPPPATPLAPANGVAKVEESNTTWDPRVGALVSLFDFSEPPTQAVDVVRGEKPAQELVRQWYAEGTAAGNHGDLYDNRDRKHSSLAYTNFPLLTRLEYGSAAKARRLDWGAQTWFLYNAVTLGNASVAATQGDNWTSVARASYVSPRAMALLHAQYRANHLYIYPEHRDHDPTGGHGDVFPVNTPYIVISQGSSGSDRPFLEALALTLAAFRPETKQALVQKGLLAPTLQMILRRCNPAVKTADEYLDGAAHPTVFDHPQIGLERMVKLAHAITPADLPPLAALELVEDTPARPGIDFFHHVPSEVLCTTPHVIGRVVRSTAYERRMVVSAAPSADANGRALSYHWRVLRGDTNRIRINPLDDAGTRVELIIPYHERYPVRKGEILHSSRVDIGLFVHNGAHYSAPAFVSLFYLANEKREYDDQQRIRSVQYSGGTTPGPYVDPQVDAPKDWRDEYHYGPDGALTGWTRTMPEGQVFEFDADARITSARDKDGRPAQTGIAIYLAVPREEGRRVLGQAIAQPPQPRPPGPRIR